MRDHEQQASVRKFAVLKYGPGGGGESCTAGLVRALPAATGRNAIEVGAAALWAKGLAIIPRKAECDELGISLVVGKAMDTLKAKRPGLWRE
jgi:hypothetical protein